MIGLFLQLKKKSRVLGFLRNNFPVVMILQCILSKLVTFIDRIYFLAFSECFSEVFCVLFLALRVPEIQNFSQSLVVVNESSILVLRKVGTHAKPGMGRCFYEQLFRKSHRFTREISAWNCGLIKKVKISAKIILLFEAVVNIYCKSWWQHERQAGVNRLKNYINR